MHLREVTLHPERFPVTDSYPYNVPLVRQTQRLVLPGPLTFFVGENGCGKSTLLRAICRKCGVAIWEPETHTRVVRNPYEDALPRALEVHWTDGPVPGSFFGSEIFNNFARWLDEWAAADPGLLKYFGGESLMTKSHGQSLMAFFRARYRIKGVYFLDEPETALSPVSQVALARLLSETAAAGHAQFIVASHSPILLATPGADLLSFDEAPPSRVSYQDTPHYRVYKAFLENPEAFLCGALPVNHGLAEERVHA